MIVPYKRGAESDALELLEVTANESFAVGEALVLSSGKLTKCGATATPTYIAMSPAASAAAGTKIHVLRVSKEIIYETELSTASIAIAAGAKYTLSSAADAITATTSSGVAEVVDWDGTTAGSKVRIRF